MENITTNKDLKSDTLIDIIVDSSQSAAQRAQATKDLYDQHSQWVIQKIGERVFNSEDVRDIAQNVWIMVLQP